MTRLGPVLCLALALFAGASPVEAGGQEEYAEKYAAMTKLGRGLSRHLVRVRVQQTYEVIRNDGLKIRTEIIPIGFRTGIVLTSEPLIVTPASGSMLQPRLSPGQRVARPKNLSELEYVLILNDGSTRKAKVTGEIHTLNMLQLRLEDPSDVPEELRHPLPLANARRPVGGDWLGIVMFRLPTENSQIEVLPFQLTEDRAHYARPVIIASNLGQIGCPVLTSDGALAGILNRSPSDREKPLDPNDLMAGAARDPLALHAGPRYLFLLTGSEVEQVLSPIVSRYETAVPYALLGISLRASGASLRVDSVEEGRNDILLLEGDLIRSLSGTPVVTLEQFDQALEDGLGKGGGQIVLEIERNGETVTVSLTP